MKGIIFRRDFRQTVAVTEERTLSVAYISTRRDEKREGSGRGTLLSFFNSWPQPHSLQTPEREFIGVTEGSKCAGVSGSQSLWKL